PTRPGPTATSAGGPRRRSTMGSPRLWPGGSGRDAPVFERVLITGAQGFLGRNLAAAVYGAWPAATVLGVGRSARLDDRFSHELAWLGESVPAPLPPDLIAAAADRR